jgi:hypothetical protein
MKAQGSRNDLNFARGHRWRLIAMSGNSHAPA